VLAFIHINKTAGRSVRYILRSSFGTRHCEVEPGPGSGKGQIFSIHDLRRVRKLYPRLESIAGHRLTGHVDLQENGTELRYFTFMREPLKTCASRFQYNVQYRGKTGLVFEEWIQRDWPRNHQTKMIAGTADVSEAIRIIQTKPIFVGLTERFDESMVLLKTRLANHLNISYEPVNVARQNSLADNLLSDARSRQMLIEANQADLALYDFVRQELYPIYQREYGPGLAAEVDDFQRFRRRGFNHWNLTLSRLKQYLLYRPMLYLYRQGAWLERNELARKSS
jgi:hypothetical protein